MFCLLYLITRLNSRAGKMKQVYTVFWWATRVSKKLPSGFPALVPQAQFLIVWAIYFPENYREFKQLVIKKSRNLLVIVISFSFYNNFIGRSAFMFTYFLFSFYMQWNDIDLIELFFITYFIRFHLLYTYLSVYLFV